MKSANSLDLTTQHTRITSDMMPQSLVNRLAVDPAIAKNAPPLWGQDFLPHISTMSGKYGSTANAYPMADQAYRDNFRNALIMRNDTIITEPLEARQRGVALLNWSVVPFNEKCSVSKQLAERLTQILKLTGFEGNGSNFYRLKNCLMEALWYGKHATVQKFAKLKLDGHWVDYIKSFSPRNGDKLVFRYDDGENRYDPEQVGIRVGTGYDSNATFTDYMGVTRRKVEATQHGLTYWLDGNERRTMAIHRHIIEDADFFEPVNSGMINGTGIRHRIYWTWVAYQECLRLMLEYIERSALGVEIWYYPAHNEEAKKKTEEAAADRGAPGRNTLLVPVPEGEDSSLYRVEFMEPGPSGATFLKEICDSYYGHKIKRYIMGQTLTSEAEATGMGSGVADAHLATYADIVKSDAINLEETIQNEILRPLQLFNYPDTADKYLFFKLNTEADESDKKMDALKSAWDMGAKIKTEDVMDLIGASIPSPGEDVLENPQIAGGGMAAAGAMGQPQQPQPSVFSGMGIGGPQTESTPESTPEPQPQPETEKETEKYDVREFIDKHASEDEIDEILNEWFGDSSEITDRFEWAEEKHPRDDENENSLNIVEEWAMPDGTTTTTTTPTY